MVRYTPALGSPAYAVSSDAFTPIGFTIKDADDIDLRDDQFTSQKTKARQGEGKDGTQHQQKCNPRGRPGSHKGNSEGGDGVSGEERTEGKVRRIREHGSRKRGRRKLGAGKTNKMEATPVRQTHWGCDRRNPKGTKDH